MHYALTPLGFTPREPLAAMRDQAAAHIHEIVAAREQSDVGFHRVRKADL